MKPEELKEILGKSSQLVFWSPTSDDPLEEERGCVYRRHPDSLCVGDYVVIADHSEPLERRRQRLAEEFALHCISTMKEDLANSDDNYVSERRMEWLFDAEYEFDFEPVRRSIIEMVKADINSAGPIVAHFSLTPELLAVINERMGVSQ